MPFYSPTHRIKFPFFVCTVGGIAEYRPHNLPVHIIKIVFGSPFRSVIYIRNENRNRIIPFIRSPSHVGWCACVCVDLSYVAVDCPCYEAKQLIRIFRVDYERIQSQCGHAHRELGKSKTVILGRRTV